jgi:hypothetical protein
MKKLLLISALAIAGLSLASSEDFAGLAFVQELDAAAMAAVDGQMFTIIVPYNGQGTATVITRERGDYCQFTVPVTTLAAAKTTPMNQGQAYKPVPLPKGSYDLGYSKQMSNPVFGTGIHINATVATPYVSAGSFKASDFFIHPTPYANTWGCVGVGAGPGAAGSMSKVLNAYAASTGSRTVIVR